MVLAVESLLKSVLITGFGPFTHCPVNASWEAVKLMNKEELERKHDIVLHQLEVPVVYENVDEAVPSFWKTHTPILTIHVGVAGEATKVTLETQAHRDGYQTVDCLNKCPANYACPADGDARLQTALDVERICREFNELKRADIAADVSENAGRYLCEYIYYTSLCVDNTRTLFVHVPDTHTHSSETVARALEAILELCLDQINTNAENDITGKFEEQTKIDNNQL